jgi:hypothetical protein
MVSGKSERIVNIDKTCGLGNSYNCYNVGLPAQPPDAMARHRCSSFGGRLRL